MIATVYVTKNFDFRRGEIYFADLDPHYGSEQGGKRPVIVIQNNTGNKFAPTVIVAAVTSKVSKSQTSPPMFSLSRTLRSAVRLWCCWNRSSPLIKSASTVLWG